jgi:ribonuclease HII
VKNAKVPDLEHEAPLWKNSGAFVFGVDEAGRGCLAGPVCAAVTCWAPHSAAFGLAVPVRDSKLMKEEERERAFGPIQALALAFGIGFASAAEIDRWNILKANYLALARALESALHSLRARGIWRPAMGIESLAFLTDGNHPLVGHCSFFVQMPEYHPEFPVLREIFRVRPREICIVKGDSKVFSIASASVLAKVSRDRHMVSLDAAYPAYEFAAHKGYSTPKHIENLRRAGPCSEHRKSFAPVTEALTLFS